LAGSFDSPVLFLEKAEGAVRREGRAPWDLVVMDLELPRLTGIETTRRLKEIDPRAAVVVLTVFEEPATILSAICAGADGYLLKKTPMEELRIQLRSIATGGSPLTPAVARTMLDLLRVPSRRTASDPATGPTRLELSDREQELLRCLVKGLAYKQAADAMNVSIDTVRTYIRRIYGKLQVHSVAEAVARAIREGLV
jgi:DNA-binding NarL/FixJ family response regulator